jgi:MFS family permease
LENLHTLYEFEKRPGNLPLFKLYYVAFGFYAFPILCLLIFVISSVSFHATELVFWVIFLVSLMPCALIGGALSTLGLVRASKRKDRRNKIIGIIGLVLGFGGILGGLLGIGLLYVVLGG